MNRENVCVLNFQLYEESVNAHFRYVRNLKITFHFDMWLMFPVSVL